MHDAVMMAVADGVDFIVKSAAVADWRPETVDGIIDGQSRAILLQLLLAYGEGRTR